MPIFEMDEQEVKDFLIEKWTLKRHGCVESFIEQLACIDNRQIMNILLRTS